MNRTLVMLIAAVMIVGGLFVWFTGVAKDGKAWAFIGPLVAGFGIALLIVMFQKRE